MKSFLGILFLSVILIVDIEGHGILLSPPGRSTRWRTNSSAPANYDDNALYCGGFSNQWTTYGGKCGVCGDDYGTPTPRPNELGGLYGEGVIVRTYINERLADVVVDVTANHEGYFYFNLCNMDKQDIETEECYLANRLKLVDGSDKLYIGTTTGKITATIVFPEDLSCQHCVLRWTYNAGNNWGWCDDGTGTLGCGPQENFKSCADIRILSSGSRLFNVLKESVDEPEIPIIVDN